MASEAEALRIERICGECFHYWYRTDRDTDRYQGDGWCVLRDCKQLHDDTCDRWLKRHPDEAEKYND